MGYTGSCKLFFKYVYLLTEYIFADLCTYRNAKMPIGVN